jgi:hypothetical protein
MTVNKLKRRRGGLAIETSMKENHVIQPEKQEPAIIIPETIETP